MPPFIFSCGLRLNMEAYVKCLEEMLSARRPHIWQQDSVPCHTSRRTQCWLSKNFCDYITPTSGCQTLQIVILLIVMYVMQLSERPKKTLFNTRDELKARIMAAFTNLNRETAGKTCKRFQSCLKAMVEANCDFFE